MKKLFIVICATMLFCTACGQAAEDEPVNYYVHSKEIAAESPHSERATDKLWEGEKNLWFYTVIVEERRLSEKQLETICKELIKEDVKQGESAAFYFYTENDYIYPQYPMVGMWVYAPGGSIYLNSGEMELVALRVVESWDGCPPEEDFIIYAYYDEMLSAIDPYTYGSEDRQRILQETAEAFHITPEEAADKIDSIYPYACFHGTVLH